MKIIAPWRGVLLLGLVLLPGIAGAACETSRDSSGAYFATCRFQTNDKPPRVDPLEVRFLRDTSRFILKLPDVTPFKYKYFVNGNSVDVYNAKMHACRVFGEDPVLIPTPPPVCN